MQKIIDTHFHEFDISRFHVLWLSDVPKMNRRIMLSEFEELCKSDQYDIFGCVHVELDAIPEEKVLENDYFCELAEKRSDFVKSVVLYADLLSPNMEEFLSCYRGKKTVSGVRYLLHENRTPPKLCLEKQFVENIRKLGQLGLNFEACMRSGEMLDLYELAKICPETTIILNHMGLPSVDAWHNSENQEEITLWKTGIEKLGELENVVCKISGLSSDEVPKIKPLIHFCLDKFGIDRVMFATNFPVCDLTMDSDRGAPRWTQALLAIFMDKTPHEKDKFFYQNALKYYRLESSYDTKSM